MQLRRISGIRSRLALATATLLVSSVSSAEPWNIEAGTLYYGEQDGRVRDLSFKSVASRTLRDDDKLNASVQIDSLTGASPTGALSLEVPQTFTRPSGQGQYTIAPGKRPLDDTFMDTRVALSGSVTRGLSNTSRLTTGLSLSKEYDYLHLGGNAAYARDFNSRNTTVSSGLSVSVDQIQAVGGTPVPLSAMGVNGAAQTLQREGDKEKVILDGLFSLTQIIDRFSLVQFNYSFSVSDGYLNDPYKLLSVLDPVTGDPVNGLGNGRFLYRHESRPDSRTGHNLYVEYKRKLDRGIVDAGYRYHTDDWGIASHTVELRFRWLMEQGHWLEPYIRYYVQSEADFYKPWLADGVLPEFASSDYRLAAFSGLTSGLVYSHSLGKDRRIGVTAAVYQTSGDDATRPGESGDRVIDYPDLSAWIVQLSYSFNW